MYDICHSLFTPFCILITQSLSSWLGYTRNQSSQTENHIDKQHLNDDDIDYDIVNVCKKCDISYTGLRNKCDLCQHYICYACGIRINNGFICRYTCPSKEKIER